MSAPMENHLLCNMFCIAIILILFFSQRHSGDNRSSYLYFRRALLSAASMIAVNCLLEASSAGLLALGRYAAYGIAILYFGLWGLLTFYFTLYSECVQMSRIMRSRKQFLWLLTPMLIEIALGFASIRTGWLFTIDADGIYHRGSMIVLSVALCSILPMISCCKAWILSLHKENYSRKGELRSLFVFVLFPAVGLIHQLLVPSMPSLHIAVVLSTLIVFNFTQNALISLDPLTGLNNRLQLRTYLSRKLPDYQGKGKRQLYLVMLDIDYFKSINDNYGHLEGDRTLRRVADVLRLACQKSSAFIARLGGDEFVIICEAESEDEIQQLCSFIEVTLDGISKHLPFRIHACMGVTVYPGNGTSAQRFLALADERLYEAKRSRPIPSAIS